MNIFTGELHHKEVLQSEMTMIPYRKSAFQKKASHENYPSDKAQTQTIISHNSVG